MSCWYISESQASDNTVQRTAGVKARDDLESILRDMGWTGINLDSGIERLPNAPLFKKVKDNILVGKLWLSLVSRFSPGDVVLVQLPTINHTFLLGQFVQECKKKHVRTIMLIHDLESIRAALRADTSSASRIRLKLEEIQPLRASSAIIVHNDAMAELLSAKYSLDASRMVSLDIFDYLDTSELNQSNYDATAPVVICGTLRRHKAGYAYKLPNAPYFNLYGVGYDGREQDNVSYYGSFSPDELAHVVKGSFGLVWDGDNVETCSGPYGEYLRVNNPHKTSMYLSMGLPVAIWKESALASFIEGEGVGIAIQSLNHLDAAIASLSYSEYDRAKDAASIIGMRLREGYYTKRAVESALKIASL